MGRSVSSSSDDIGEASSSGTVEVSDTKEREGVWEMWKLEWRLRYAGDDSGRR